MDRNNNNPSSNNDTLYKSKYDRTNKDAAPRRRGPMGGGPGRGGPGGGLGRPVEKAKDFKGTLKRCFIYMAPYKWYFLFIAILCVLSSVLSLFTPKLQGNALNVIAAGSHGILDTRRLLMILLNMGLIYLLSAAFGLMQRLSTVTVSQKLVYRLRSDVEAKLSRLPLKYFDSKTHGEILSRVTNDIDNISNMLQQSITQIISSIITLIGVLIMMMTINLQLMFVALCFIPLYIVITNIIAPKSQRYFIAQSAALGDINGHIEEMFTGHKIVKAFAHEQESINEFEDINQRYYEYSRKAQIISGLIMPSMRFIGNLSYVVFCVLGGIFVASGRFLIGDMQSFLMYVRQFNMPISQMSGIANNLQSTVASAERVFDILNQEEEIADSANPKILSNPEGLVRFNHIEFGYSPTNILMHDLDIEVMPGQTIAIVGPTGAGKTTLVNLLMRFYDVSGGSITVDGIDIRDITRSNLRSTFGMVLQDTWLFIGSIRENISYGKPDAPEEEIVAAARAARADHFIRTLAEGYNTVLNEEASNISQGQKQLLTIARAFLSDPSILILDEATSSVDTRTEVLIQTAMEDLMKGRTSFVIAHRLSTIRNANLILVMHNGDIIEQGTHDELLEKGGFYYELYHSQFTGAMIQDEAI